MPNLTTNNILECFASIQGEGVHIGIPSIFIRFVKCNLSCPYCDTKYSWSEEGKYDVVDVIDYINENQEYKHVVITGGEPLLHQSDIVKIVNNFPNKVFTIETNGTLKPSYDLARKKIFWSVSPKLYRWNESTFMEEINGWNAFINCQFKFVVETEQDFIKIQELICNKKITKSVIVQPNGIKKEIYGLLCQELADYVIKNKLTNFRVLPQFQKICWGQRRRK